MEPVENTNTEERKKGGNRQQKIWHRQKRNSKMIDLDHTVSIVAIHIQSKYSYLEAGIIGWIKKNQT